MSNLKKYALTVALTFSLAFVVQYLASVSNVFAADWSTLQLCVNAGIAAVFAWFVAYAQTIQRELAAVKLQNEALTAAVLETQRALKLPKS